MHGVFTWFQKKNIRNVKKREFVSAVARRLKITIHTVHYVGITTKSRLNTEVIITINASMKFDVLSVENQMTGHHSLLVQFVT